MADLVGRFARDVDFDKGRILITRAFPDINIVHYIYVDKPGGGSQNIDRLEIEPHPADEANRLRQEIEDLRDIHWEEYKALTERATWLDRQGDAGADGVHHMAETARKEAALLTQILEGLQV